MFQAGRCCVAPSSRRMCRPSPRSIRTVLGATLRRRPVTMLVPHVARVHVGRVLGGRISRRAAARQHWLWHCSRTRKPGAQLLGPARLLTVIGDSLQGTAWDCCITDQRGANPPRWGCATEMRLLAPTHIVCMWAVVVDSPRCIAHALTRSSSLAVRHIRATLGADIGHA